MTRDFLVLIELRTTEPHIVVFVYSVSLLFVYAVLSSMSVPSSASWLHQLPIIYKMFPLQYFHVFIIPLAITD
jgi:hypothetical protein